MLGPDDEKLISSSIRPTDHNAILRAQLHTANIHEVHLRLFGWCELLVLLLPFQCLFEVGKGLQEIYSRELSLALPAGQDCGSVPRSSIRFYNFIHVCLDAVNSRSDAKPVTIPHACITVKANLKRKLPILETALLSGD